MITAINACVLGSEFVPTLTVRLALIGQRPSPNLGMTIFLNFVVGVVGMGSLKPMGRITTRWVVARVTNNLPWFEGAN